MTNPTRTRAEIQAEIEELQKELENAPEREWSGGDKVWVKGVLPFKPCADEKYGVCLNLMGVDRSTIDSGGAWFSESALIPAVDLIPREEHERAVKEARAIRPDEDTALENLLWHCFDIAAFGPSIFERDYDGHTYRVTVERVDHIVDANKMIEPANAEPVAWANRYSEHKHSYYYTNEDDAKAFAGPDCIEIAVPLYRHPAPSQPDAEPVDQASANRLVEWYAANNREHKMTWSHEVNGRTYFVCVAPHDGTGYAPDPQAVAPSKRTACVDYLVGEFFAEGGVGKRTITHSVDGLECELSINVKGRGDTQAVAPVGVKERLLALAYCLMKLGKLRISSLAKRIADDVAELPPPSEFAQGSIKKLPSRNDTASIQLTGYYNKEACLTFAAQLVHVAALLESEGE